MEVVVARVKLSEFRAKSLLIPNYTGVAIGIEEKDVGISRLNKGQRYVVKVDQGVKKRAKSGLLKLNVTKEQANDAISHLAQKGYRRFIAEPMVPHSQGEEHYLCFERTRNGIVASYGKHGGVDIESHGQNVKTYTDLKKIPCKIDFIQGIVDTMDNQHMSFVEINPLVIKDGEPHILDAAVLVDGSAEHVSSWTSDDVVDSRNLNPSEAEIASLNDNSPASFSFRVLNPNGAIWLLLSGGGASITIADEANNLGKADQIGNYGEYSGGPTTEETYLYTTQLLRQMGASDAPRKALVIAGGVANFTDVKKTFTGIIQALEDYISGGGQQDFLVYVRRGGPNEKEGLKMMESFLKAHKIYGSIHGSDTILTDVIIEALEYVDA